MDLNELSAELLREMRGSRLSQRAASKRLGYGTNVVYLWERGKRFPSASMFLRLAEVRRLGTGDGLREFLGLHATHGPKRLVGQTISISTPQLLQVLAAGRSSSELAKASGYDRNTLARWLRGTSEPRLPDLLKLVGVTTQRLIEFVSLFVDPARLESTRLGHDQLRVQRELAYSSPWCHAVLRALEVDGYQQARGDRLQWLAGRLGLSRGEIARSLELLEKTGQVHQIKGVYHPTEVLSVDTRGSFDDNLRLKKFWSDVSRQRLEEYEPNRTGLFSYNLFAISEADMAQLRQLHIEYFERVRQLVATAKSADRVVLFNLQLIPLDE